MNKDEYIESLENLLIFMCETHEEQEKVLLQLAKDGNDAFFQIPKIQGLVNTLPISQLSELEFNKPRHGFKDVYDEIIRKRK